MEFQVMLISVLTEWQAVEPLQLDLEGCCVHVEIVSLRFTSLVVDRVNVRVHCFSTLAGCHCVPMMPPQVKCRPPTSLRDRHSGWARRAFQHASLVRYCWRRA